MVYMIEINKLLKDVEDKKITELFEEFDPKEELLKGYIKAILIYFKIDKYLESDDYTNIDNFSKLCKKKNDLREYIKITNDTLFSQ